jgi:ubiquinone/menaquinone biosynthesis C-methylase UbiE
MGDTYSHGHHPSVLRSHQWRTAENSAGYLLASLRPGQSLLDVGCGPGTITADLADLVAPGEVVGIDREPGIVHQADALAAARGRSNLSFATGDVYVLDFPDDSFDVVHAHQVLQHLTDPVAALVEMRRVLRPGGILAVRESDYGAFTWAPPEPALDRWLDVYHRLTAHNGAQADAGRRLLGWVQTAGFEDVTASSSTWTFADPSSRAWWGDTWAERVLLSSFADQAMAYGLADRDDLEALSQGWRRWAEQPDGFFAVLHGEVLARG